MFIEYKHHGAMVWANTMNVGQHRFHCLCHSCDHFKPGQEDNCERAQELYEYCVKWNMTTPVFECPVFKEKK